MSYSKELSFTNFFSEDLPSEEIILEKKIIGICAYEPGCDTVCYSYTLKELGKRKCKKCIKLYYSRCNSEYKMCQNINCNLVFTHDEFSNICHCTKK